ncbi:ester cyclase [Aspergillus stella-maris]|uniref:ester cyclase n=1 Tax=Aspergillus stella-maris TaxID=1810926 RepID=UPI003CCDFD7D
MAQADKSDIPLNPLPTLSIQEFGPGLSLIPPLSRRGHGPGMILLVPDSTPSPYNIDNGIPTPSLKWAEEGYAVFEIRHEALHREDLLEQALEALREHEKCTFEDGVGLVAYGPLLWQQVQSSPALSQFKVVAIYADASNPPDATPIGLPTIQHLTGSATEKLQKSPKLTQYDYRKVTSCHFAIPGLGTFDYAMEAITHSRNLTFFKKHMNGPYFDLEAIWDEHQYFEFFVRSVEHTMSTMVQEPYVNHIPTMTGGIGRENLTNFYRDHFIFCNPPDIESQLISRTVGIDRVVDECIMTLTHDCEIDYLLPGIPPTGRKLEIPYTAIVNIRGDRLYNEHIHWDQATVLRQLGFLPEYIQITEPLPGGKEPSPGKSFQIRTPVLAAEMAAKVRDKNAVPSNELLDGPGVREV